ncbi:MAG: hypothetical protein ACRD4Y_05490 [Candidatus Acidiferrales bacterium]
MIRILGISLALVALLAFSTGVVSDWNHHDSTNDTRCPYCHLSHQAAGPTESNQCVAVLNPVDSLPLPVDSTLIASPVPSNASSRAPPAA